MNVIKSKLVALTVALATALFMLGSWQQSALARSFSIAQTEGSTEPASPSGDCEDDDDCDDDDDDGGGGNGGGGGGGNGGGLSLIHI